MPPVPSCATLRHLSRLCQTRVGPKTSLEVGYSRVIRRTSGPHDGLSRRQHKPHTGLRCFVTSGTQCIQPSSDEPDQDPQHRASPKLPDITNYYTLFPTTLPNGPPRPLPLVQTATADAQPVAPSSQTARQSQFHVHPPTLRKEFLQLQSLHHPDKYSPGSPAHQKALALSALINTAYRTLADPLLRAQYLLQLQYGIDVTTEDNAAHPTDQATLMEVMDAQERVEEATTEFEIEQIKTENLRRIRQTEQKMAAAFEAGDVDSAKGDCVRLKYWRSLHQGLHDWEPGKEVRLIH